MGGILELPSCSQLSFSLEECLISVVMERSLQMTGLQEATLTVGLQANTRARGDRASSWTVSILDYKTYFTLSGPQATAIVGRVPRFVLCVSHLDMSAARGLQWLACILLLHCMVPPLR